jgi:dipeptidyl aminopeptidase/acylaminoacyl peptidase
MQQCRSRCCAATTTRFGRWRGHRTAGSWPPGHATGRFGSGTPTTAASSRCCGHDDWIQGVVWSPAGRRLASASGDRTARIWDTAGGTEHSVLRGHDDRVRGVAWSPDGRRLASGSSDRTVRIWDVESGTEIIVVGAHAKGVESVSWCPHGRRVASASQDGTSRVWDATISVADLVAVAHRRVSRKLTADERRTLVLPSTG